MATTTPNENALASERRFAFGERIRLTSAFRTSGGVVLIGDRAAAAAAGEADAADGALAARA